MSHQPRSQHAPAQPFAGGGLVVVTVVMLGVLLCTTTPAHSVLTGFSPQTLPASGSLCDAGCTPAPGVPGTPTSQVMADAGANGPAWLFDTSGFPGRWNCGTWSAGLGWLHIISDIGIWGAYMAIPAILAYFALRRRSPLPTITWLFVAFIASCGFGHLIEAAMFWTPLYRFGGVWKLMTALVSWATVLALIPVVPRVLRWPSLDEINRQMSDEIELRKDTERALAGTVDRLEHAAVELRRRNGELETFVYTASHDLKSPLVTIVGYATHIKGDSEAGRIAEIPGYSAKIIRASNRMRACVDDLLELSRVGHVGCPGVAVDLRACLDEVHDQLRDRIEARGIRIEQRFAAQRIEADPERVKQVLQNLIGNAVQYGCSKPDPCIEIGSIDADREFRLFVRDNGVGIAPEHHSRIFDLFQRLSEEEGGTGVGLAIVRRIAETHGGRCWVESEPGNGATFWVSFPHISK